MSTTTRKHSLMAFDRGVNERLALASNSAISLVACDDGSMTDAPTDGVMRTDGATMRSDAGVESDAFMPTEGAFVEPGCESLSYTHGACSMDSASPECVCDAGWTGGTCESFDASDPSDTGLRLDAAAADHTLVSEDVTGFTRP